MYRREIQLGLTGARLGGYESSNAPAGILTISFRAREAGFGFSCRGN
jgi:hypothetical protein